MNVLRSITRVISIMTRLHRWGTLSTTLSNMLAAFRYDATPHSSHCLKSILWEYYYIIKQMSCECLLLFVFFHVLPMFPCFRASLSLSVPFCQSCIMIDSPLALF